MMRKLTSPQARERLAKLQRERRAHEAQQQRQNQGAEDVLMARAEELQARIDELEQKSGSWKDEDTDVRESLREAFERITGESLGR